MRFFHGSRHLFDRFSLEVAGREDRATNGALGVWVCPEPEIPRRFGGHLYEVSVEDAVCCDLSISGLLALHERSCREEDGGLAMYDALRRKLLAEGFTVLRIVEKDGSAPTQVILDPEAIRIVEIDGGAPEARFDCAP